ncbi:MAG TPA: sugar transferase [Candidatus Paceibacterota bacterium]|nr:sugar transferase [Candidatus Paceibacterota bacterium]
MLKRLFDFFFSGLGLIILSPVFLVLAIWIKLDSPGPVFYRGVRMGKDWKTFRIFKFRSMVQNAEQIGGPSTRRSDPRLTPSGRFMRKWKLDELPQLINVFIGNMSLVGPRPEVVEYANMYKGEERIVYTIRPGITDYASLWNSHEEEMLSQAKNTEEAEKIYLEKIRPEKVRLQVKYVKEMSLWTDIKIIFKTLKKIFL